MAWNWLRRHPYLVDTAVALFFAVLYAGRAAHQGSWTVGVPLGLLGSLPLVLRRRSPFGVLAFVTVVALVQGAVRPPVFPVPAAFAVFTVAAHRGRLNSLAAGAAATAAVALEALATNGYVHAAATLVPFAAFWVFGDSLGTRRAYTNALEERAERLEREREAEAARAVAEEQARIARELHDVIAHNVSVMVVQAAAANDVFDSRPDRVRESLRAIEATGRSALVELRRLLGTVRDGDGEYAPQPGLDRIDELVDTVRAAGLEVTLRVDGAQRPLPAALELSAYRVVQEALTNVLKHARASRAEIALRYGDRGLDVEVRDDGAGSSGGGDGAGRGLIGMRERVAAFGGSLAAGPAPAGGFEVAARFPL